MPSLIPGIPIDLDRPRTVRLDNRAIFTCELELSKLWGKKLSFYTVLSDRETLGVNDLSVMLWQGLRHEDAALTLAEVQEFLPLWKLPSIVTVLFQAWNAATEDPDAPAPAHSDTGGDDPLAPSPGGTSGGVRG